MQQKSIKLFLNKGEFIMSARMLFLILLVIGGFLVFFGIRLSDKGKIVLILMGTIILLISGFGIFTSFL